MLPGDDGEKATAGDEQHENDPEADTCMPLPPPTLHAGLTPGTVLVVRATYRIGVDRGFIRRHALERLGHMRSLRLDEPRRKERTARLRSIV